MNRLIVIILIIWTGKSFSQRHSTSIIGERWKTTDLVLDYETRTFFEGIDTIVFTDSISPKSKGPYFFLDNPPLTNRFFITKVDSVNHSNIRIKEEFAFGNGTFEINGKASQIDFQFDGDFKWHSFNYKKGAIPNSDYHKIYFIKTAYTLNCPWLYDSEADTIRQIHPLPKRDLKPEEAVQIVNSDFGNKFKIKFQKQRNDTAFVSIPNSWTLTQSVGSTEAQEFIITATFTITDATNINYVFFDFEPGDNLIPGVYFKEYFIKQIRENKKIKQD